MKIYSVGGSVRDKLLGIESKDLDYVVVLEQKIINNQNLKNIVVTPSIGYVLMKVWMEKEGFQIFLETPDMFTIRARFPKGHKNESQTADFVLARKEVGYIEGTRRPILELGTLEDDLARRDFTINAMAEDEEGNLIDLYGGQEDLNMRRLRTPLDPKITFLDDPLRVLRAFRFSITKGMHIPYYLKDAMSSYDVFVKLRDVVSQERIREELQKMFKHDTQATIRLVVEMDAKIPGLMGLLFENGIWLKPTTEKR